MRGAIPAYPNTPSWRGAQLKHRDNFTFTFSVKRLTVASPGLYKHERLRNMQNKERLHLDSYVQGPWRNMEPFRCTHNRSTNAGTLEVL